MVWMWTITATAYVTPRLHGWRQWRQRALWVEKAVPGGWHPITGLLTPRRGIAVPRRNRGVVAIEQEVIDESLLMAIF